MKMETKYIRAMLGPMEGVMDAALLSALFPLARPACFTTPFLRVSSHPFSAREIRRFLRQFPPGPPVLLQLMGVDAEKMAETAYNAQACGVLGINLNFGCPSSQVVRGGAGAGVLRQPDLLQSITRACVKVVPSCSVSVKMRGGYASFAELPLLLEAAANAAPDFLILHTRTFQEKYQTVPNMPERRKQAAEWLAGRIPLILNGDLTSPEERQLTLQNPGVCGTMCARGVLQDPFLLRRQEGEPDLPDAPTGRLCLFCCTVRNSPGEAMPIGEAIGLAKFIFGSTHPMTLALKKKAISGTKILAASQLPEFVPLFFAKKICNRAFDV